MAILPKAKTKLADSGAGFASGADRVVVIGCAGTSADIKAREFMSTADLLGKHGYCPAVDYCAMHFAATGLPVQFIALPIATAGAITKSLNTKAGGSTSVLAAVADSGGIMDEIKGTLVITQGGTVGTDQIRAELTLNEDTLPTTIKIGTANSYVLPYVGIKVTLGVGILSSGDKLVFSSSSPSWQASDLAAARAALAAQQLPARTWLVVGDIAIVADANAVVTQANAYETTDTRFVVARIQARDILPQPVMTGTPTLTFATATPGTITRSAGSWITDGFKVGMSIAVTGSAISGNNGSHVIGSLSATVITLVGDSTTSDATVAGCTVTGTESSVDWRTAITAEFAPVAAQRRVDITAGRARTVSPILHSTMRRPAAWALSIREYLYDVQVATWKKANGQLEGWSLLNSSNDLVEHDERVYGGLLSGGFSCLRSWSNGPLGTFAARSLTRALDSDPLVNTHHMHVANLAMSIVQAQCEYGIGDNLVLNDDGTGDESDLSAFEMRVTSALEGELTSVKRDGQRASAVKWTASRTDDLSVAEPELNGILDLRLLGTLVTINTTVKVNAKA